MAISSETRRAGPFTGDGAQRDFPFAFKVFSADQVKVVVSVDGVESTLDSSAYAVTLESDQDGNPGGVVSLTTPLASGSVLAILSAVPMLQPMVLTNRGGFYPATLNDSADRAVILAQQLSERLDRAITVDATDTMSPSELKQKLLDAANEATVVAKGYAESAKASADAAAESEEKTAEYAEAAKVIKPISAEIKKTADNIDAVKTAAENIEDVKTVAANKDDVHAVAKNIEDVTLAAKVSPHIDDITSINAHIDEVHRVGQDLVGMSSPDFDLGSVTETPDETTKVVDGYIKKVAEHIDDCIHPVGDNLDAIKTVAEQLEPINDVADLSRIDYESIFLNGIPEGDTNGLSD